MCKFIGKSNERILCKLSKSEILRLYSIVHVAMETTKTSHFTCWSKSFISIFFTCQVSACELQPFSCHDLANDIYSQTAKTVFSHERFLFTRKAFFKESKVLGLNRSSTKCKRRKRFIKINSIDSQFTVGVNGVICLTRAPGVTYDKGSFHCYSIPSNNEKIC